MIFATILGASLGAALASFGGVLVTRIPRGESVLSPASACASCRIPIRACDNVPIVSWLALRGRCRVCAAAIPRALLYFEVSGAILGGGLAHALFGYARLASNV